MIRIIVEIIQCRRIRCAQQVQPEGEHLLFVGVAAAFFLHVGRQVRAGVAEHRVPGELGVLGGNASSPLFDIVGIIHRDAPCFKEGGAEIREVSLPNTEYGIAVYYLICTAEASSNLSRFDGVRYGYRSLNSKTLEAMYADSRNYGFGDEVKRRIILGTYVLSAGYYDAYYRKAQKARTLIRKDFEKVFQTCDFILSPTTPTTAFKIGENIDDPLSMYLYDIYTVTAPLAGMPAISIPAGKDQSGLPIGIQITGKPFGEGELLGVANWLEKSINHK